MSQSTPASSSGIGVTGLLGVAFVVLKLLGKITWPWKWVLVPFWGPIVLLLVGLLIIFAVEYVRKLAR